MFIIGGMRLMRMVGHATGLPNQWQTGSLPLRDTTLHHMYIAIAKSGQQAYGLCSPLTTIVGNDGKHTLPVINKLIAAFCQLFSGC